MAQVWGDGSHAKVCQGSACTNLASVRDTFTLVQHEVNQTGMMPTGRTRVTNEQKTYQQPLGTQCEQDCPVRAMNPSSLKCWGGQVDSVIVRTAYRG